MALYLCLNQDGTGVVSEDNPIQTKHTSNGEAATVTVYVFNDGKRKGVPNDTNPPALVYTNIQLRVEGVGYSLEQAVTPSTSDVTINFDSVDGWNIGTILKSGLERMRIEEVLTSKSVRVQRNYSADGKNSTIQAHSIGSMFIAETTDVSLALPSPNNYDNQGTFELGGASITSGIDPTLLTLGVDSQNSSTTIKSNNGARYSVGSLIKINNEVMKILSINGNDLTVIRGFNGTNRQTHSVNSIIYCIGINDVGVTHKFFIKNDPPSGLPTQKKKDIKIVVVADEEPV